MIIRNADVFLPDGHFHRRNITLNDRICAIESPDATADPHAGCDEEVVEGLGCFLIPGMIDVHAHGSVGYDFSDGDPDAISAIAQYFARHGVTSYLATTMTLPESQLVRAAEVVARHAPVASESCCIGVHLEGPFFSEAKKGAQNPNYLHAPDYAMFSRINLACQNRVKLVAVAPELPGAMDFIEQARACCAVAIGHTAADYDQACAAFSHGATQATHLFNGMNEFLHRAPGAIGAAMDCGAFAELICDGLHNHPSAVRAAFRMFPNRIVLISDALRCAGMPDGEYRLGGQKVVLRQGAARLVDGTLAGSVITVLDALQNAVRFGIPLEDAVAAATLHPAQAIRMADTLGSIAVGRRADLVLLSASLSPVAVFIGGRPVQL